MMILDVLEFISASENRKNIYNYLKELIAKSGIGAAYEELTRMRAIKDKIATFVIRDICLLNLEIIKTEEDYKMAFPIDIWVRKIASELDCFGTDEEIKICLIKKCIESKVDPLKFAAGLWFLGFHSLEILIRIIKEIEIQNCSGILRYLSRDYRFE